MFSSMSCGNGKLLCRVGLACVLCLGKALGEKRCTQDTALASKRWISPVWVGWLGWRQDTFWASSGWTCRSLVLVWPVKNFSCKFPMLLVSGSVEVLGSCYSWGPRHTKQSAWLQWVCRYRPYCRLCSTASDHWHRNEISATCFHNKKDQHRNSLRAHGTFPWQDEILSTLE